MTPTKISVIIPIHNTEKYLEKCLDSILTQSLSDIEVICVDDNSTDGSYNILEKYQKKDTRIKLVKNDRTYGAGYSRNVGIEIAQGEYLYFIDADDFIENNTFEILFNKAQKNNTDIVIFHTNVITNNNVVSDYFCPNGYLQEPYPEVFNYEYLKPVILKYLWNIWNKLYKTEFIKNNNIKYMNTKIANDITFNLETILNANRISYINQKLYYYRANIQTSITNFKTDEKLMDYYDVLSKIKEIMENKDLLYDKSVNYQSFLFSKIEYVLNNMTSNKNKKLFKTKCRELLDNYIIQNSLTYENKKTLAMIIGKRKYLAKEFLKKISLLKLIVSS